VAPAINFRKWYALEGDVTFTTKNVNGITRSAFTYLVGPRLTKRSENSKLEPFVHALFGGGHIHASAEPTTVGRESSAAVLISSPARMSLFELARSIISDTDRIGLD